MELRMLRALFQCVSCLLAWPDSLRHAQRSDLLTMAEGAPKGAPLLDLQELLTPAAFAEVPAWWSQVPIVGRSRGRWVFHEPKDIPGAMGAMPRQRVRRQLDASAMVGLEVPGLDMTERHNKSSINTIAEGPHLDQWKEFALKSTNTALNYVPTPPIKNEAQLWLRMMERSHGSNLKPGGLKILEEWQASGATKRQKEAFSELMWSLNDHLTAKRGRTETKIQFGPKVAIPVQIHLIDPFFSSLGRPSDAPIAHAVQLKAEARKRAEEQAKMELAEEYGRRQKTKKGKDSIDTLESTVPFKWPGAEIYFKNAETATQTQQRTVKPTDTRKSAEINPVSLSSCPPASYFMRTVGAKEWHGDAKYAENTATAKASFPFAVDDIPRTQAYHRKKQYVV